MPNFSYDFLHANGKPGIDAEFKHKMEDFKVVENLGFEFSGSGEHFCVLIEKTGLNTNDVVKILSRHYDVSPRDISYAGLKDRQAVTQQWFSLRVGIKRELDFNGLSHPAIKILEFTRNSRKIRRGSHKGNTFSIRLKNLIGDSSNLDEKISQIRTQGVPNYFGKQRFGKNQDNVSQSLEMLRGEIKIKDRFLRGIYLSAARAWLFNQYLSNRVEQQNWNTYLQGDVMALEGTASYFTPDEWDEVLEQRLLNLDIHPSGPLWGRGELQTLNHAKDMEDKLLESYPELCNGLVEFSLKQERRALRLCPQDLQIYPEANGDVMVEFALGKGAYATSVLRELVNIE